MSLEENLALAIRFLELHDVGDVNLLDGGLPIVFACDGMVVDV